MPQKIAIVGSGFLGLTLALRLADAGQKVTIFESASEIGGLASAWQLGDIVWDRHYHVTLLSDKYTRKIVEEIFPQKELLKIEVKDGTSDVDALNIAMNLERRSHQFFTDFAKQISDANGRKIFMDFAKDEESHLRALVAEYNSLTRS